KVLISKRKNHLANTWHLGCPYPMNRHNNPMLHHSSSFDDNKRWNNLACSPDTLNKRNKLAIVGVVDKDPRLI
ncbi:DDE-1 domain containing protein, partial [Pyrenophora tritici-repentis]